MSQPHEKRSKSAGKEDESDEALDDMLKQLGEDFLDEQVPDALLDVLRRGHATRSDSSKSDETSPIDPDQTGTSDKKR